ncbi:MAG: hypothetical protein F6K58_21965 [Symploca sp. SIO2E9]|nr:hypothetical protein [Symploca sp. SIO2E9]
MTLTLVDIPSLICAYLLMEESVDTICACQSLNHSMYVSIEVKCFALIIKAQAQTRE